MSDAQAIIDATREQAEPHATDDGVVHFIVPDGARRELHDPEVREANPSRARGTVELFDLDSFARRVEALATDDCVIYADPERRAMVAVLNDDGGDPGWRDHRAEFTLRPTPQWAYWTGHEGLHDQQKFAEIIEDGLDDIASPEPATMLEIARTFTASIGARFRQAARLRDGARQFVYEETVEAKGGESGEVTIPEDFRLLVAPFIGSAEREITARLRFRINSGQLAIGYALPLAGRLADDAFTELVTEAVGRLDPPVVLGRAPYPTSTRA